MAGRGGKRKASIPAVDVEALEGVMDLAVLKFKKRAFQLGEYDILETNMGASGQGLLQNQWWLNQLLPLCNGEIIPLQLRTAIKKHASSLNDGRYKHDLWAAQQAQKFRVLLNHWRRLKHNEVKKKQAMAKLGQQKQRQLEALLALSPGLEACKKAKSKSPTKGAWNKAQKQSPVKKTSQRAKSSSPGQEPWNKAKTAKKNVATPAKKKAVPEAAMSPVSVDTEGYPMILQGSPSGLEESPAMSRTASSSSGGRGLQQSHTSDQIIATSPGKPSGLKQSQNSGQKGSSSLPLLSKKVQSHQKNLEEQAAAAMALVATKTKTKQCGASKKKSATAKRPAAKNRGDKK
eukprot:Skav232020  [mRNA]  locus=scaffold3326:122574:123611:+ [translate_table: standard]